MAYEMTTHFQVDDGDPDNLKWIAEQQLEWLEEFARKARDYGNEDEFNLGLAGQYADMSRKFKKLRRAMWDGKELTGEQPAEILHDLIGHAWITLYRMQKMEDGK